MPVISVHHDPAGIAQRDIQIVPADTNLFDWLIDSYGPNGFSVPTRVYKDAVHEDNEIILSAYVESGFTLVEDDAIHIVHTPQDPMTAIYVVTAVMFVATIVLAPTVDIPVSPSQESANESPNNNLTQPSNKARPLGRIPDIYGRVPRACPDLIAKPYYEYKSNLKFQTNVLCLGRGEFHEYALYKGETLLDDIDGSEYTKYEPDAVIPLLLDVTASDQIDGQEIYGANEAGSFTFNATYVAFEGRTMYHFGYESGWTRFADLKAGDLFTISNGSAYDGEYTFLSFTYINDQIAGEMYYIEVEETLVSGSVNSCTFTAGDATPNIVGPFTVAGTVGDIKEVWVDIVCPRGLRDATSGDNLALEIRFTVFVYSYNAAGDQINVETSDVTISGNTLDAIFRTVKLQPEIVTGAVRWDVAVRRNTNTSTEAAYYDVTKVERIASVRYYENISFGNVTTYVVQDRATEQALKSSRSEIYVDCVRKINGSNVEHYGNAILHHLTDQYLGNKSVDEIDVAGLFATQIVMQEAGTLQSRFSYTFSDSNAAVGDEIKAIANACRLAVFRVGQEIRFASDWKNDVVTTVFTPRTKRPNSDRKSIKFNKAGDYDGIELSYRDKDTNETVVIKRPADGTAENPKKIDAIGIIYATQANARADYEWAKMQFVRETVEITVGREGLLCLPLDRVRNVDGTNVNSIGGEVKSVSGDAIGIREDAPEGAGFVTLRSDDGISTFETTGTVEGKVITLSELPPFPIVIAGEDGRQVGTQYMFATAQTEVRDYLVNSIEPMENHAVKLKLVRYDERLYDSDVV